MTDAETHGARLFVPEAYCASDPAEIVRAYPFALLTTHDEAGIHASSTPLYYESESDETRLIGHLARRNGQAKAITGGQPALAVFSGPHAYVSSRWYQDKPQVPTWDYVAAHVRGTIEPLDGDDDALAVLHRIVEIEEAGAADPWTMEKAPAGRITLLLPMIRAFRIHIDRIEGVTKLNQTHPVSDRIRIADALRGKGESPEDAIARLIVALPG